ncbi:hypothetical protein L6164_030063 [Bauhinia variegata]|uniref:Uncharacterized protein n=1 Tax=Bauhinia variegata TaxID=167791 RepID=A0ACB9LBE6_BAUVA|nr:hypothetical protein L6164_030063 [Bauhinia variegata]
MALTLFYSSNECSLFFTKFPKCSLEERLQRLIKLLGAHKTPLSRAERQFQYELALRARLRRHTQATKTNIWEEQLYWRCPGIHASIFS